MEFQFGTNWGPFSQYTGQFFGNILGFEGATAFMLEAGFGGIMCSAGTTFPMASNCDPFVQADLYIHPSLSQL